MVNQSLPKLKTITLDIDVPISLDLLLGCKSLETLFVNSFESVDLKRGSEEYKAAVDTHKVEYLLIENRMGESNAWKLFPKLESMMSLDCRVRRPSNYNT